MKLEWVLLGWSRGFVMDRIGAVFPTASGVGLPWAIAGGQDEGVMG